jgi:hypothetical protein
MMAAPIDVVKPDSRMRFNLGKLLPKVDRYAVYTAENGGIRIEPVTEDES